MFGLIEFEGVGTGLTKRNGIRFDRLAINADNGLMFVSLVADAGIVKAINAVVNTDRKVAITASGVKLARLDGTTRELGALERQATGYRYLRHRLGLNTVHAMFLSKAPGVLTSTSDDHLWQELMRRDSYTTPMIREWLPYMKAELLERDLLRPAYCHNCQVGAIYATTNDLDDIVETGLRSGSIAIPSRVA